MTGGQTPVGSTYRVDGVDKLAGLAELHEALPKVIEGSLDEDFLLFVVVQQVVPKRLLGKSLRVPHDDHTIPSFTSHTHTQDWCSGMGYLSISQRCDYSYCTQRHTRFSSMSTCWNFEERILCVHTATGEYK